MAVDVTTSIEIECPLAAVAAYTADPSNATEWYVNIKSIEWETEPKVAVGARAAFVAQFMGRRMAYTYEIVTHVPEELMIMRATDGPFPMETSYLWEAVSANTTRMTLRNRGTPGGFLKMFAPLMAGSMRRANRKDLELLKQLLEAA